MKIFHTGLQQVNTILALRTAAIAIQIGLILFVNFGLDLQLPWLPLLVIVCAEIVYTLFSYFYYQAVKKADKTSVLIQIAADIGFLSCLLYFSGGATNAFVSLLLIPIAIAAVALSPIMLAGISLAAISSYSVLLWLMPMHVMHGNMEGHFIAMWVNFLFSTFVVAIVVGKMARSINQRELAIAAYREEQLKQEKVISLGVASAQITHQLATPIATAQLLVDELKEDFPDNDVVDDMAVELARCSESLSVFREMVFDIKEQVVKPETCQGVFEKITDSINLNYPDISVDLKQQHTENALTNVSVMSDAALLPAILNLVNNAVRATKANSSNTIELTSEINETQWHLTIRDFGSGFKMAKLAELGVSPVESEEGLGMAVLLSHTSLERFGGKLSLSNHPEGGAKVLLALPLVAAETTFKKEFNHE